MHYIHTVILKELQSPLFVSAKKKKSTKLYEIYGKKYPLESGYSYFHTMYSLKNVLHTTLIRKTVIESKYKGLLSCFP